jgi:hypothetical protein
VCFFLTDSSPTAYWPIGQLRESRRNWKPPTGCNRLRQARKAVPDIYEQIHGEQLYHATVCKFFTDWVANKKSEMSQLPRTLHEQSGYVVFGAGKKAAEMKISRPGVSFEPVGEVQNQRAANGRRSRRAMELPSDSVNERRRKAPTWSARLRIPKCHVCACPRTVAQYERTIAMKTKATSAPPAAVGRVVGLDLHPDVFSAAVLSGRDAATAPVVQNWDRLRTNELAPWAKQLAPGDVVVLEATGNTFDAVERLHACGLKTVVLETQCAGQIRTAYCTNDRTDAVKLARIYSPSSWASEALHSLASCASSAAAFCFKACRVFNLSVTLHERFDDENRK